MPKTKVSFFYPHGQTLTGQELASKLILNLVKNENYNFIERLLPAFARKRQRSIVYLISYLFQITKVWCAFLLLSFKGRQVVYLNLGQSMKALVCDGFPFLLCSLLNPKIRCVISLHSHLFCRSKKTGLRSRLFTKILKQATLITILGPTQKIKLLELGIPDNKIMIVNNTCEPEINAQDFSQKINGRLEILFLSNLIETKGYREYLSALLYLSKTKDCLIEIDAILCGNITGNSAGSREAMVSNENWIEQTITKINISPRISIKWLKGAYGKEKKTLFHNADIFVYPSSYPIDAQPIVLIEAMATSTAIICSDVGEIPALVGNAAIILNQINTEKVAHAIMSLANDDNKRSQLVIAGRERFNMHFSSDTYASQWDRIFSLLLSGNQ